jgi:hypothetical protein
MLGIWLKFAESFACPMKDFVHHENRSHVRIRSSEAETPSENTGGSSPAAPLLFFPRLD